MGSENEDNQPMGPKNDDNHPMVSEIEDNQPMRIVGRTEEPIIIEDEDEPEIDEEHFSINHVEVRGAIKNINFLRIFSLYWNFCNFFTV